MHEISFKIMQWLLGDFPHLYLISFIYFKAPDTFSDKATNFDGSVQFSSVQFSRSVVSDFLQPHES